MRPDRRPIPPLNAQSIERLALRYVERFATTRAKLVQYLARKTRERGWDGEPLDATALADRFVELGYIDDRLFAEAKAGSLARRGFGRRRVDQALRHAGIGEEDAQAIAPQVEARSADTAIAFARKRRIGPFAEVEADRALRHKQVAAMVRAGHSPDLSWKIARMMPGESVESLLEVD